jgi:hypothetical protein
MVCGTGRDRFGTPLVVFLFAETNGEGLHGRPRASPDISATTPLESTA